MGRCEASLRNPFMGFRPAGLVYRLDLLAKGMEGLMGTAVPVLAKSTFLAQDQQVTVLAKSSFSGVMDPFFLHNLVSSFCTLKKVFKDTEQRLLAKLALALRSHCDMKFESLVGRDSPDAVLVSYPFSAGSVKEF